MATAQNIAAAISGPADAFYIECSLPTGLTIAEYRRLRPQPPSLWRRSAAVLRGRASASIMAA